MKTAEEILMHELYGELLVFLPDTYNNRQAIKAMKAYAKQVAEQALKDASENANYTCIDKESAGYEAVIDKQSILQTEIKLP